jgi:3D (Asp-Asp-Asp) domain-containing protein
VTGAPGGSRAASLRVQRAQLQQRSHNALLELYSIETRLERARAQIAVLDRQELQLERESATLRQSLRLARKTIAATQRNLGDRVRALYESGDVNDPIAIILGAESIDDAVTRLEGLEQIVNQQKTVLRQATEARSKLLRLKANLERRRASIDRLRTQARASAASLEAARSAKAGAIHRYSSEKALTSRRLAELSAQATEAATTSIKKESKSAATSTTAAEPASGNSSDGERTLTVSSTCYCLKGNTASGLPVGPGIIATDPTVIPLGTRVYVPGYGKAVAADTGPGVKGLAIDLWVASCAQAQAYGRRTVTITVY